ncbi:hypothetical protein DFP73DRAFT_558557 [Morchella snyderi]|nr:hypothetical protein DFP73DRAFT_558557 [Morchella snyderi]
MRMRMRPDHGVQNRTTGLLLLASALCLCTYCGGGFICEREHGTRSEQLINQLLAFARLETLLAWSELPLPSPRYTPYGGLE